jgi:5'-deoxynucleotidase YfbR-like HD superfamily hydrolase
MTDDKSLIDAVLYLAELAMRFGRIDRAVVSHPDGTPESDSDHTVMLGWLACSLAAQWYPQLDLGLVAQFALVHDAPEVYAGDTPTLRIDDAGLTEKHEREQRALDRLTTEFAGALPWFPNAIASYERQQLAEARFVRALDKVVTRMVHVLDGGLGLRRADMDRAEWDRLSRQTLERMLPYAADFSELLMLRAGLGDSIRPMLRDPGCASDAASAAFRAETVRRVLAASAGAVTDEEGKS